MSLDWWEVFALFLGGIAIGVVIGVAFTLDHQIKPRAPKAIRSLPLPRAVVRRVWWWM